jgi:hypothetical protein
MLRISVSIKPGQAHFESVSLQLPRRPDRAHYVRCPVLVHEFPEGTLGISYQGRLLARYTRDGQLRSVPTPRRPTQRNAQPLGTAAPLSVGTSAPRAVARAAGHPTPGLSPPLGGAAVHNVDGDTVQPRRPATYRTVAYPAVHNVGSSCSHHPGSKLRAVRKPNKKTKNNRSKTSV